MIPETMKAALVRQFGSDLTVEDRPVPTPGPGEVLIRVETCGICHTDLHTVQGAWSPQPALPFVPGHEAVGRVAAKGPEVTYLHVGDRVAVPWLGWACGRCHYCLTGSDVLCRQRRHTGYDLDGGFAQYMTANAAFVVGVPPGIDPLDAACLSCAGVNAYKAVKVAGSASSQLTAVFGVGGVGHLVIQYARIAGAEVVAVDITGPKITLARELGASHAVHSGDADPVKAIQRLGGADQAVVTAASPVAVEQALASLKAGGTLVLVAMPPETALELPVYDVVRDGIAVVGSPGGNRADLQETFALHTHGRTRLVHQARGLHQINQALRELEADTVPAKLVLEFR